MVEWVGESVGEWVSGYVSVHVFILGCIDLINDIMKLTYGSASI